MRSTANTLPADQCRELGIAVGDTIEGSSASALRGEKTRLTLLWLGNEMTMWMETRMINGEWTTPRESAMWDLSWREWEKVKP